MSECDEIRGVTREPRDAADTPRPAPTLHEAVAEAWKAPGRRLARQERRLRRRVGQLDAGQLTRWYAVRQVLRQRGRNVPPITRGLP